MLMRGGGGGGRGMLVGGGGGGGVVRGGGGGGGGGNAKKESPDFRFSKVGISGLCTTTSANTLIAIDHFAINIFFVYYQRLLVTCYFHCSTNDTLHY